MATYNVQNGLAIHDNVLNLTTILVANSIMLAGIIQTACLQATTAKVVIAAPTTTAC
jgi:hypothetical protein